jgi:two-component system cell cycle sensor histidine kinase/response regulator CckA
VTFISNPAQLAAASFAALHDTPHDTALDRPREGADGTARLALSIDQPTTSATAAGGAPETVLVVEDEDVLRRVVQRVLERHGYVVHVAPDGIEALQMVRELKGQIDLVLTDVMLPEMNGPLLARHLAAEWPRTKVLFMTGYANDEVFRRGLLDEGTALLRKPFTLEEMAQMVRGALDGQPAQHLSVAERA